MPGCLEAWRLEAWTLEPWRLVGLLTGCLAGLDWLGVTGGCEVVVRLEAYKVFVTAWPSSYIGPGYHLGQGPVQARVPFGPGFHLGLAPFAPGPI